MSDRDLHVLWDALIFAVTVIALLEKHVWACAQSLVQHWPPGL